MKVGQGIYEHYKSTKDHPKYYQVLLLSHNESDGQTLVHYQPLYWDEANDNSVYDDGITVWTRTLDNFYETVEYNGKKLPRFKRISN